MVLKQSIIAIIIVLILDSIWIFLNKNMYNSLVLNIQGTPLKINVISAILAYILMFISLFAIVFPSIRADSTIKNKAILALKHAGIVGLVIYGIFNTTNLAIFTNYSIKAALLDTCWGVFVYFMSVYLTLSI